MTNRICRPGLYRYKINTYVVHESEREREIWMEQNHRKNDVLVGRFYINNAHFMILVPGIGNPVSIY